MQTIQNTVISALEGVKDAIEKRDEEVLKREKVFSEQKKAEADKKAQDAQIEKVEENHDMEKFKQVSFELLDIGIFYGQKTMTQVKSLPLYQKVDSIVKLDDKFSIVK